MQAQIARGPGYPCDGGSVSQLDFYISLKIEFDFFFFFFGQNITDALCSVKETGDRQGPTQTCYVRCLRSSWTGYAKSPSFPTLDYI